MSLWTYGFSPCHTETWTPTRVVCGPLATSVVTLRYKKHWNVGTIASYYQIQTSPEPLGSGRGPYYSLSSFNSLIFWSKRWPVLLRGSFIHRMRERWLLSFMGIWPRQTTERMHEIWHKISLSSLLPLWWNYLAHLRKKTSQRFSIWKLSNCDAAPRWAIALLL